ncbi:DUF1015 domain-containing protein [Geodermatophilus sp. SYSU D00691]
MSSSSVQSSSLPATGLEVRPFRALTYRRRDPGHLARVSSPAYDLVTPGGRERLAEADPHNIVRLILPRVEPSTPGAGGSHPSAELSARTLREWQASGVLERDERPALWRYEMRPASGAPATVGWLGAVALPAPGSRAVLPHEDTYPVAVEGRRALLAATRTDLEPIVLAHDPDAGIAALTQAAQQGEPALRLDDSDGVSHRLWRVSDPAVLADLTAAFAGVDAVIADGHHRFAAAQAHARSAAGGGADAILALLTPMGPGGLRVEAIHRVVPDLPLGLAVEQAAAGFRVRELPTGGPSAEPLARRWLADPAAEGFLLSDGQRLVELRDPSDPVRLAVPPEAPAAWRGLDVVLAHHGLLERLWGRPDDPASVLVAHDVPEALRAAGERHGTAVLLRAPSPADVAAVARAGARMPRKSTLFVPKPRTGLVLRPHAG